MRKQKIALLFGGCSPEYGVSLESAYAVITAIPQDQYEAILIGITKEGAWYRFYGSPEKIKADTWHLHPEQYVPVVVSPNRAIHKLIELHNSGIRETLIDAAFIIMHGKNGEDGTVQGIFEMAGIPIIGCGTLSSALCMDKVRSHRLAAEAGIRVPESVVFDEIPTKKELVNQTQKLSYPFFVKPVRAGSSFGIRKILSETELLDAVENAFLYDSQVIVEECISGFEVGCAVLGTQTLLLGAVDEIELSDGFFDYKEKYTLQTSKIHMPARITPNDARRIQSAAALLYRIMGCAVFARVDMFFTPEKEIVFNEINTIPGFTAHSRYPNMMRGAGLSFSEVVERIIKEALEP